MANNYFNTAIFVYMLIHIVSHATEEFNRNQYEGRYSVDDDGKHRYPNLYFSADDLPKLRAQTATSHAGIYQKMTKHVRAIPSSRKRLIPPNNVTLFNARWNEMHGNMLALLAVYCALTPQDRDAFNLAKLFMERFTSYNTWLVTGMEKDEVPLAHSLLGYATCFDCLHNSFTKQERARYAAKISETGTQLFDASNRAWWGRSHIHNHVATNYMALLTAAIVLKPYYPEKSREWQEKSFKALDATMKYLKLVVDGSFQEGVSYGSYTMRSLTQFMLISERHLARNYRTNNWLREHFNFMLYTIIPGFELTVGFADSNLNWAYGPGSNLAFMDMFVHNDGKGNWVTDELKRRNLEKLDVVDGKSVLYTEFLFYNNTLKPKRVGKVKVHVFSDWGVITYGGGVLEPHVFLAFKCSYMHGRAINLLRPNLSFNRRRGFVPGHEQPDQGSFVFVAKDQAVVTEPRYGPKYTYLQNTLMFGPSPKGCTPPYLGQLGECNMWFKHKDPRTWDGHGDIVGYSRENDVIFMSGEMTQVYDADLGLTNVYRALVMLEPSVLVAVDIVRFRADSVSTHGSAFFHNANFVFNMEEYDYKVRNRCAGIGRYRMCWSHLNAETVDVSTKNNFKLPKMRFSTNFVNITWKRSKVLTSTAYVFHGSQDFLQDLKLSAMKENGIKISLKLNSLEYNIILSTRHDDPRLRRKLLGSNGYGKVYVMSKNSVSMLHLGVKTKGGNSSKVTSRILGNREQRDNGYSHGYIHIIVFPMLLFLCFKLVRHRFNKWIIAFCLLLTVLWLGTSYVYIASSYKHSASSVTTGLPLYSTAPIIPTRKTDLLNAVLITGLPLSGVELARELFTTNPDFVTIGVPSGLKSTDALYQENLNLCEWTKREIFNPKFAKWWKKLLKAPITRRENNNTDYIRLVDPLNSNSTPGRFIHKSQGAFAAVFFKNPGWLFRASNLFRNDHAPLLYIVRDPRSWIEHMLSHLNKIHLLLKEFKTAIEKRNCNFPLEIENLRKLNFATLKSHIVLANIWTAFATYAHRLSTTFPRGRLKIVHFEKIITLPRETADDVYTFLEMPFPAAVEHRIMQVAKTGLYKFENYGTIEPKLCTWGQLLKGPQISEIEKICKVAMKNIGYL